MESFWQDVSYGVRVLAKTPRFTVGAVVALALAVGANTAIFSLVNAILLRQLPFDSPDSLMWVTSKRPDRDDAPFSLPEYIDYRDQSRSFKQLAAYVNLGLNLTGSGDAERLQGIRVSANFFVTLGARAHLGRTLRPQDDVPGNPRVVVIADGLWQRRFGGDPNILGRALTLNGTQYEVVGVLAPEFIFPDRAADLAFPLVADADPLRQVRSSVNFLRLIGRLDDGVSRRKAEDELTAICYRLREQYPVEHARDIGVRVTGLHDALVGNYRQSLWVLLCAMGIVLLTMCANLAHLMVTRASARHREMALRHALGASRSRIIQQVMIEGLLLAVAGGGLGALLATQGLQMLLRFAPSDLPRVAEVQVDAAVLMWTVGISILAGLVFAIAPALQASQADPNQALKEAGRGLSEGKRGLSLRNFLVVFEVGLATVLLVTGGLLLRSFAKLQQVDPGFDTKGLVVARLSLPATGYPDRDSVSAFYERLRSRLEETPGMQSIGAVSIAPIAGLLASVPFTVEEQPPDPVGGSPDAQFRMISAGYMATMGIPVLQGREFTVQDTSRTSPVALINQKLAQQYFPQGEAVGKQLRIDDNNAGPRFVEIVGVVGNIKQSGLDKSAGYDIYVPILQHHPDGTVWLRNNMFWTARTTLDPSALVQPFRDAVRAVAYDVPVSSIQPMEQYLSTWMAPRRFNLQLLSVFASAGLLLAASGIYAVISYSVALRTREIGIRIALGAQRGTILLHIVRQGALLALAGAVAGLAGSVLLGRVMRGLLFAVDPLDLVTYAAVAALLVGVSVFACCMPALRATRIDPLLALRHE